MSCFTGLEDVCQTDVALAPRTWYRLGGAARWLLTPRSEAELRECLERCAAGGIAWRVLGRGANVLVRDAGFDGAVISLSDPSWQGVHIEGALVRARGGADFPDLVNATVAAGLAGLHRLAGIPGTVGGLVRMNAGGKYGAIADFIRSVRVMDATGGIEERAAEDLHFGYRRSSLDAAIVLEAVFALQSAETAPLRSEFRRIWKEKTGSQPTLGAASAGCIFKNPSPEQPAGLLLDRAGLKGARVGRAQVSTKHANFIVAEEGATAQDVLDLIALAQQRVRTDVGVELELEIEVW
jgi:UDP-N-acetylmuramate dehydrogenase